MMRMQGLEQTTLFERGSAAPYRADRDGVSTHCLQTCLEAAASAVRLSSASVPSSLQSSCRDNTMLTQRSLTASPRSPEEQRHLAGALVVREGVGVVVSLP